MSACLCFMKLRKAYISYKMNFVVKGTCRRDICSNNFGAHICLLVLVLSTTREQQSESKETMAAPGLPGTKGCSGNAPTSRGNAKHQRRMKETPGSFRRTREKRDRGRSGSGKNECSTGEHYSITQMAESHLKYEVCLEKSSHC